MLGLLYAWAPDAAVRRRILVENAAAAFDFAGTLSAP
jgi:predicted TIM-barrel fold metal-dependent hydrolase